MTRFIPKEKMSKKARGELDRRQRRTWPVPPVTKAFASKKNYSRKRKPCDLMDDGSQGFRFWKKEWLLRREKSSGVIRPERKQEKNVLN